MEPVPNFVYFIEQLPDPELEAICTWLTKNERDYLTMMGELTKFRPIFIKTKAKPSQQRAWFRKFAAQKPEFSPIWLLAYGTKVLVPIEEAALAKLPIELREELGYQPTDRENPVSAAQISTFLKEAEAAYGTELTRQWGNIFLLLMEPGFKAPVAEALDGLEWNLSVPPGAVAEIPATDAAPEEDQEEAESA